MRLPLWVNAADDLYLNVQALQNCENLRSYTKVLRNIKKGHFYLIEEERVNKWMDSELL